MIKRILALTLLLGTAAFAHAHLKASVPAQSTTVKVAPTKVHLDFTEEVNTKVSVFKVYPLAAGTTADGLLKTALPATGDAAQRLDSAHAPATGSSSSVDVSLKPNLKPGTYAVLWRVMAADDGHITQGAFTFTYRQ